MFMLSDVEFARTLIISSGHSLDCSSLFIRSGEFAIEVDRHLFLAEVERVFSLISAVPQIELLMR